MDKGISMRGIGSAYGEWVSSDRPFTTYPVGTRARAHGGGYWEKLRDGKWKWCTGASFPVPGGDWDGTVCLPVGSTAVTGAYNEQ
jgi:hypothetical protein